ncbi:MAG TPA: hypothetical protein VMV55_01430, partial [Methanoregula sp.]|nr:hypothetical protein [Methanoregula sp.]
MKINIQIEDASPEEAGLIFAGIAVSDAIKRSAANAVDEIVRHKPGPDPTYDEIKQEQAEPAPRKTHNKPNKFGIPASLFSTDNKAYSAAWA